MTHKLKIWPQYYEHVAAGNKNFEVRENDRGYQPGDLVILQEFDLEPVNPTSNSPKGYTGSPDLTFKVGYVLSMDRNMVVFSLLPIKNKKS